MYINTHIYQSVFTQIFTHTFIIILTIHDNGSCGILIFAYNVHHHIHPLLLSPISLLDPCLFSFDILPPQDSTNERKHLILCFSSLAYGSEPDDFQFPPFICRQHGFVLLSG